MMKKRISVGIIAAVFALCILGCGETKDEETEKELKISGIPTEAGIVGAALKKDMNSIDLDAVGKNDPASTFKFYNATPGSYAPDESKPWKGKGEYYIVLSAATDGSGEQYFYTEGAKFNPDGVTVEDVEAALAAVKQNPTSVKALCFGGFDCESET